MKNANEIASYVKGKRRSKPGNMSGAYSRAKLKSRGGITTKAAMRFGEQRRMATALWSGHSIPRSDETLLPEWSGRLGGV